MLIELLRRLRFARRKPTAPPAASAPDAVAGVPELVRAGRVPEAEQLLRATLAREPARSDALLYLGLLCHQGGRSGEALVHLHAAAAAAPGDALLHANLAEVLRATGDLAAAEEAARAAVRCDPRQPVAQQNLAAILAERGQSQQALDAALAALALNPEWPEALILAAQLHIRLDRRDLAQPLLARVRALRPDDGGLLALTLLNRAWLCDWAADGAGDSHGDHQALLRVLGRADLGGTAPDGTPLLHPFLAHEYPVPATLRARLTQAHANAWCHAAARTPLPASPAIEGEHSAGAARRLRIAYLSADFHDHPTLHLMGGMFARHARERFEVFAYSMGPDDGSAQRRRVQADVEHFVDIRALSAVQSAARIRADGIDILVDLKGFTHEARPLVLALQPAALRVAWLGYPASTGRGLNDYLLADRVVAPPAHADQYGEALVWLPDSYQVNDDAQRAAGRTPSRDELGLPQTGCVFACFNHVYKIEPRIFGAWMRILARVPGSVLWLYATHAPAAANLRREAAARGIDPGRLVFAGSAPKAEHLARLRQADLMLDTLLVNAHTGASDALWAGLPLLTCAQDTFASRVAASALHAAGLAQLACSDLAEYEERAVSLAIRPQELAALREHLRNPARLPLFDTARFVRHLEQAYLQMWERQQRGLPPQAFAVAECAGS